jgi:hypothetical protein
MSTSTRPSRNGHAEKPPSPKGDNGRGPDGRFVPGWRGGPGNPHFRELAARRSALLKAVSAEDVTALARKWLSMALEGDLVAGELLVRYVVGTALPAADPDAVDADELRRLLESPESEVLISGVRIHAAAAVLALRMRLVTDPQQADVAIGKAIHRELLNLKRQLGAYGVDADEADEGDDDGD